MSQKTRQTRRGSAARRCGRLSGLWPAPRVAMPFPGWLEGNICTGTSFWRGVDATALPIANSGQAELPRLARGESFHGCGDRGGRAGCGSKPSPLRLPSSPWPLPSKHFSACLGRVSCGTCSCAPWRGNSPRGHLPPRRSRRRSARSLCAGFTVAGLASSNAAAPSPRRSSPAPSIKKQQHGRNT